MKKKFLTLLCILTLMITGCTKPTETPKTLQYQNIQWGIHSDEVVSTLSLDSNDYHSRSPLQGIVCDYEIMGTVAEEVVFLYRPVSYELQSICVFYPDDADMDAIKTQVIKQYGIPAKGYTVYIPGGLSSQGENYDTTENGLPFQFFPTDSHTTYWVGTDTLSLCFDKTMIDTYIEKTTEINSKIPRKLLSEYVETQQATYIFWTDNYGDALHTSKHKNALIFSGEPYVSVAAYQ